jgi:hypothetical protein
MRAICDEVKNEFGASAARSTDWGLGIGTGTIARPLDACFEAWLGVGRPAAAISFVRRPAAKRFVRPFGVIPVEVGAHFSGHEIKFQRHDRQRGDAFGLQGFDEAFNDCDASVLTDCAKARPNLSAFAPGFEARAPELGSLVGDDVLWLLASLLESVVQ